MPTAVIVRQPTDSAASERESGSGKRFGVRAMSHRKKNDTCRVCVYRVVFSAMGLYIRGCVYSHMRQASRSNKLFYDGFTSYKSSVQEVLRDNGVVPHLFDD
jgi:hypothetical protein